MQPASVCVHGHFYQPPREDPLTGSIPREAGAKPHHNWNERIHAECYRPNAEAGNFAHLSFNFGPTLFSWMKTFDPATYQQIIVQDRANVERFGVGNALAQAYHHTILPLASYEDKVSQVAWGVADFEQHFGRKPQGMWLPETAANTETLTVLADHGIEFTILAPWQADSAHVDTSEPYRVALPDGRSIVVFFYHQDLSGRISFDPGITANADAFVRGHLAPQYLTEKAWRGEPQLVLLASDGELYGHHRQADSAHVDTSEPYRVALPDGRSIVVFFYHQDLSGRISFDPGITANADAFVRGHLAPQYLTEKAWRGEPQLVLLASDGELYGHHQPFRDKFLAYLLGHASAEAGIAPTYPARWLREHPPRQFISIRENTSWSCHHGVARWMEACDCTPSTLWKAPLRHSLNHIAQLIDSAYVDAVQPYVTDPLLLRHRYINVVLGQQSADDLVQELAGRRLDADALERIALLLRAQYERQRVFTSCGWFFDDFDRIEPQNNVRYMAQAMRLTYRATGLDLAAHGLAVLQHVISQRTGRRADQVFGQHLQRA